MCGVIAQLVEHRTSIAEVTGSNPVLALISSGFFFPIDELYCPFDQSGVAVAEATNAVNTRQSEAVTYECCAA